MSLRLISALFWDSIPHLKVIQSALPLNMGPICCSETSVRNYQCTLCKIQEERRYPLHRGGNLKSRIIVTVFRAKVLVVVLSLLTVWSFTVLDNTVHRHGCEDRSNMFLANGH